MKSFPAFGILMGSRGRLSELISLLESNSGLPGPRGNLELAHSFAKAVAGMNLEQWQWDFLVATAGRSANKAPVNTAKEFPPFCATLALGAQYGEGLPRPRRRAALAALAAAAEDQRWRMRESCAMGLQLVGERDPAALRDIIGGWLPGASFLTMRGIAAALAHPPLLSERDFALFALDTARPILAAVARADRDSRRTEPFKILRQGMGYALSVFVAACPAEGFVLLRKSAAVRDPDIGWIVRENLKKKRLTGSFPKEVAEVGLILEDAGVT